eukprot:c1979_g1_i1.p1 GENE.c1979_g1_i1~~c1979_g1_i1.p1  ORF type:complete len:191 (-),score=37.70 c1979_g1_i1:404-976(-)
MTFTQEVCSWSSIVKNKEMKVDVSTTQVFNTKTAKNLSPRPLTTNQAFLPLSPPLNPNAAVFTPTTSPSLRTAHDHLSRAVEFSQLPMLDDELGVETSAEDLAQIEKLRKALPKGQRIRYSIKDMMGMKPLNPNAAVFTPLWLQGIHTETDYAQAVLGCARQQHVSPQFPKLSSKSKFESAILPQMASSS